MMIPNCDHPTLQWPGKPTSFHSEVVPLEVNGFYGKVPTSGCLPDMVIHADNLSLLSSLAHGPLGQGVAESGGIKLIYCDPPFFVGTDFSMRVGNTDETPIRAVAYSDSWTGGLSGFLSMLYERLVLMHQILDEEGSLFLHCDWRTAPHLRLLLDEIFGPDKFLGDIVWHYTGGGRSKRWFSRKHDRILHYRKGGKWTFNVDAVRVPYKKSSGYAKNGITSAAGKHYAPNPLGTPVDDVWEIPMINPLARERIGYPTQKPEALLDRIILAASNPGDLVADFFCGSGTTAVSAQKSGRRFMVSDSSPLAVSCTTKRLLLADAAFSNAHCHARHAIFHEAQLEQGVFRYALSKPRLRVERLKNAWHAVLETVAMMPESTSSAQNAHLAFQDWTAFVDWWSLGLPCKPYLPDGFQENTHCVKTEWHSVCASSQSRMKSGPLPPSIRPEELRLAVVDIFGNISRFGPGEIVLM